MNKRQWLYFKNKKDQNSISLEDLLEGFDAGHFDSYTWIKPPRGIYWSRIMINPEYLSWCYVLNGVVHIISKKELFSLCKQGIVLPDTYVRFEGSVEWEECKKSFIEKKIFEEESASPFYGYYSLIPSFKIKMADWIDSFLFYFLSIYFIIESLVSLNDSGKQGSLILDIFIVCFLIFICILFFSAFQAFLLNLFGWTIGSKLMNFYFLTYKKEKMSFLLAFKYQLLKNFTRLSRLKKKWSFKEDRVSELGARLEDSKYKIIVSIDLLR